MSPDRARTRTARSDVQNLMITFLADINHDYDDSRWTMRERNKQNGSKSTNHKPQTWPSGLLLPETSARWLTAAEHETIDWGSSRVIERHRKYKFDFFFLNKRQDPVTNNYWTRRRLVWDVAKQHSILLCVLFLIQRCDYWFCPPLQDQSMIFLHIMPQRHKIGHSLPE